MPQTFCDEADEQSHLLVHIGPIQMRHGHSAPLSHSLFIGLLAFLKPVHYFAVNDQQLILSIHLIIHSVPEIVLRNVSPQNASVLVGLFESMVLLPGYLVVSLVSLVQKKNHQPGYPRALHQQKHVD